MGTLPADKVTQCKHDGFLSPFPLLDDKRAAWRAGRVSSATRPGWARRSDAHPDLKWRSMPYLLLPWAARLARDPRILDKVEDLLGPDILILTSTFFIKEPHSPTIAAWHQDFDLLRAGAQGRSRCLDCPDRGQRSGRLHGRAVLSGPAAPAQPCLAGRPAQRQSRRTGHHRAAQRPRAGGDAARAGLLLHASWPLPAPVRAKHLVAPPHWPGAELHTDPSPGPRARSARPRCSSAAPIATGHFEPAAWPKESQLGESELKVHERAMTLYRDAYLEEEARLIRMR